MVKSLNLLGTGGAPVQGQIALFFSIHKSPELQVFVSQANALGEALFDNIPPQWDWLIVAGIPNKNHVATFVEGWPADDSVTCEPLKLDPWWIEILGLRSEIGNELDNITPKLGIIDTSFGGAGKWTEVLRESNEEGAEELGISHHGRLITSLLTEPPEMGSYLEIVAFGAAKIGNEDRVDFETAANGILQLVDLGVDVISMSFGRPNGVDKGLRNAIQFAVNSGVVCIAACGNDGDQPAMFPASDSNVIGVGAVASPFHLPNDSLALIDLVDYRVESLAQVQNELLCSWPSSSLVGADDVVAPGVGIVVKIHENELVEVTGSSFAAPLVAAVFGKLIKTGEINKYDKWDSKIELFYRKCKPLGNNGLFGRGIPVVRSPSVME